MTSTAPETSVQNDPSHFNLYNVPSFYSGAHQRDSTITTTAAMIHQNSISDTVSSITAGAAATENSKSFVVGQNTNCTPTAATESAESTSIQFRDKCISFLAMLTALAALTCAAVAMAGTASWVDTWEPIDLPPVEEWPSLFGTGYGNFLGNGGGGGGGKLSKSKSGSGLFYHVTSQPPSLPQPPNYHDSYWVTPDPNPVTTNTGIHHQTRPTTTTTTGSSAAIRFPTWTSKTATTMSTTTATGRTAEDDDLLTSDEDDYYADDEPINNKQDIHHPPRVSMMIQVMKNHDDVDDSSGQMMATTTTTAAEWVEAAADDPQSSGRYAGSLVVVFHVGLFRACPVLKGELPANIGKSYFFSPLPSLSLSSTFAQTGRQNGQTKSRGTHRVFYELTFPCLCRACAA